MFRVMLALTALIDCGLAQAEDVKIVIEAEHYGMLVPHMAKVKDETASGGWCIEAPPMHRAAHPTPGADSDPGYVAYRTRVPADGTYRLWGRCWWSGAGCAPDSFWLRIGQADPVVFGQDGIYQRWHWVKGPQASLPAGEHVIVFRYREERGKLDQFLLENSRGCYAPVRVMRETPQYLVRPPQ